MECEMRRHIEHSMGGDNRMNETSRTLLPVLVRSPSARSRLRKCLRWSPSNSRWSSQGEADLSLVPRSEQVSEVEEPLPRMLSRTQRLLGLWNQTLHNSGRGMATVSRCRQTLHNSEGARKKTKRFYEKKFTKIDWTPIFLNLKKKQNAK